MQEWASAKLGHFLLVFRVLIEAGHPDVADAVTVQGVLLNTVCQEKLYNPGRDVSINPNQNPILTPQLTVPDVRLGYASTGQSKIKRGDRVVFSHERPFGCFLAYDCPVS